jgi:hypothetical protein
VFSFLFLRFASSLAFCISDDEEHDGETLQKEANIHVGRSR